MGWPLHYLSEIRLVEGDAHPSTKEGQGKSSFPLCELSQRVFCPSSPLPLCLVSISIQGTGQEKLREPSHCDTDCGTNALQGADWMLNVLILRNPSKDADVSVG